METMLNIPSNLDNSTPKDFFVNVMSLLSQFYAKRPTNLQLLKLGFWLLPLLSEKLKDCYCGTSLSKLPFLLRCSNTSDGKTFARLAWCAKPGARWTKVFKERLIFISFMWAAHFHRYLFYLAQEAADPLLWSSFEVKLTIVNSTSFLQIQRCLLA